MGSHPAKPTLIAALAVSLGGCCLDIPPPSHPGMPGSDATTTGSGLAGSTGGSTGTSAGGGSSTGVFDAGSASGGNFEDAGLLPGTLWVGGYGALKSRELSPSGTLAFDVLCPYPPSSPAGAVEGSSMIDGFQSLWAQDSAGDLYVWSSPLTQASCPSSTPATTLSLSPLAAVAFDSAGNLWGSIPSQGQVVGYRAADVQRGGFPAPAWLLHGSGHGVDVLSNPSGLAFDSQGVLWVGDRTGLLGFRAATREAEVNDGTTHPDTIADLRIGPPCATVQNEGRYNECLGSAFTFLDIAFDAAGDIFASTRDTRAPAIVAYTREQLADALTDGQPAVAATLGAGGQQVWGALAFDRDGNLWAGAAVSSPGNGVPNLFRFPGAALLFNTESAARFVKPDVALSVPANAAASLAFSPIPSGLPLQP